MSFNSSAIIIRGAFNCYDNAIGKFGGNVSIHKEYETLKNEFALVDVWRNLHPASREFTWFTSSQSIGSRLDKFFISRDLLSPGIECDMSLVRFPIMISFLLFLTSPLGSNK